MFINCSDWTDCYYPTQILAGTTQTKDNNVTHFCAVFSRLLMVVSLVPLFILLTFLRFFLLIIKLVTV